MHIVFFSHDTVAMLYVERDLSAIVNGVFAQWDNSRNELNGKYLQASNARVTPMDITSSIEKGKVLNSQVFISVESADIQA